MSDLILDASIALRWILDFDPPKLITRIREFLDLSGNHAVVPQLWYWEVINGLLESERHSVPISGGLGGAWARVEVAFSLVQGDAPPAPRMAASATLAREYGLTAYDVAYLELAPRRGAPLMTQDQQLRHAAERAGVAIES